METIRLHNMVLHTKVLGPGVRCAIWLQGCGRSCKGCMSPSSRDMNGGKKVDISDVYDAVIGAGEIEGVTISGGEPFAQIESLYSLIKLIKETTNLGVIVYTGYTLSQLRALKDPLTDEMLEKYIDLLIDGEYDDSQNDGSSLRGSSNQNVIYLTERYKRYSDLYENGHRDAEIIVTENELFFVGIPDRKTFEQWEKTAREISASGDH